MAEKIKISFGKEQPQGEMPGMEQIQPGMAEHQKVEKQELEQLKQLIQSGDTQNALALLDKIIAGEQEEDTEEKQEGNPEADYSAGMDKILNK